MKISPCFPILVPLLLLLAVFNFSEVSAVSVASVDAKVLLEIKSVIDPEEAHLLSWVTTEPCETWVGITCTSSGRVSRIILTDTETVIAPGETVPATLATDAGQDFMDFPSSFSGLTFLEHLVIANTVAAGYIPNDIGNLGNLKTLNFSLNQLFGPIPSSIGNITSLQILDLQVNALTQDDAFGLGLEIVAALNGTVPPSISNLTSLLVLDLHSNRFSGSFPPLSGMTNLTYLNINNNNLTGNFSSVFGVHPKLTYLDIAFNNFTGDIPEGVGNYSSLRTFYANENSLVGDIPTSFGSLTSLKYLNLGTNLLESVPSTFGNLKNLVKLVLRNNLFAGVFPSTIGQLSRLVHLEIDNNGFNGTIPDFSNSTDLQYLDLSYNGFTGFPDTLGNLSALQFLALDFSNVMGPLPSTLTQLKSLNTLTCRRCNLAGPLPSNFGDLSKLNYIDLSENNLTGSIPASVGNLIGVNTLYLGSNQLSGQIPDDLSNLVNLTELTLNNNDLSGTIPSWLGSLASLSVLQLQGNALSGTIPTELGNLGNLNILDLSSNNLNGPIPLALGKAGGSTDNPSGFQQLVLSNNQLEGSIPYNLGNLTSLVSLQLRNMSLTGTIPLQLMKLESLQTLDLSYNSLTGFLPTNFFENFTSLVRLTISTTSIYGRIPDLFYMQRLKKLDLSYNQFSGDIPAILPASLIAIDLSNNYLSGNLSSLENVTSLETLFAQNNEFSGTLPSLGSFTDILSLSNNNLTAAPSLNRTTNQSVDLFGNPVCSDPALNQSQVCSKTAQQAEYTGVFPCANSSCIGDNVPNPYVFIQSNYCICSAPSTFVLSIFPATFQVFTNRTARKVQNYFATELSVSKPRIFVKSAISIPNGGVLITFLFFGRTNLPPATATITKLLSLVSNRQIPYPGLEVPSIGFARLVSYSISELAVSTEANGGIRGSSSGLQHWALGVIIGGSVLLLLLVLLLVILLCRLNRKPPRQSSFALRVQEHFVKFIPLSDIQKSTKNFSDASLLGEGGYGTVYKGKSLTGETWAVKRAKTISLKGLKVFQTEVDIISRMNHTNIVRLLGYCDEKNEQILVYEFMANGTLKDRLAKSLAGQEAFPFAFRLDTAIGAAEGLRYLHNFANPTIIHRDVKSENILFDEHYTAKVADFGLLKDNLESQAEELQRTKLAGTPGYIDPEYFQTYQVTTKSDVYSFGVLLLELITGKSALIKDKSFQPGDAGYLTALVQWSLQRRNDLDALVDPHMGEYNAEAMLMLVHIAFVCVDRVGRNRPDMEEVCRKLTETKEEVKGIRAKKDSAFRSASSVTARSSDLDSLGATYAGNSNSIPPTSYGTNTDSSYQEMSTILGGR